MRSQWPLQRLATAGNLRAARALSHRSGPLQSFLESQAVVVLDGGFGTAFGPDVQAHPLWGAQLLFTLDGHTKIEAAHRAFLEAGADVISSASYQASFEMFQAADAFSSLPGGAITSEKFQVRYSNDVLRTSVELAKKARYEFWKDQPASARMRPLVAASVGPAGDNIVAWTGATDENTNVHDLPDEVISLYYERKLTALARAKPDLVALETLPGLREARLALAALDKVAPALPCWVSFICRSDEATAAGDDFGAAAAELWEGHDSVHAVGLNCTSPAHVRGLLERARERAPSAVLLAYPNSGESWDAREGQRCWHEGMDAVLDGAHAVAMRDAGARVIGGCCRVTHGQIREFREALL